jgi:uncharacterized damage-inducible protein DinB
MADQQLLHAIRFLFDYDARSTDHLLDVCQRLDPASFTSELVAGQPSIRNVFAHMCSSQSWHLAGWKTIRTRPPVLPSHDDPAIFGTVADIRALWIRTHAEVAEFVASLAEDDLQRTYIQPAWDGSIIEERPLWPFMLHVANHGTQHRAEIATMLTALGHSPGDMDLA